jgi:hypothetical protein
MTHIRKSNEAEEDIIRLTLPVTTALERFTSAKIPSFPESVSAHLASTQEHWGLPLDAVLGLRGMYMPYEEPEKWEDGLLGMVAVLSEATIGQGNLVAAWVVERMKRAKGRVVEKRDVEEVGKGMYREALR